MRIFSNVSDLVGNTPLVRLDKLASKYELSGNLIGKLEFKNPGGSVKDRIAKNMIEVAEEEGLLGPESIIIEPTSGNTGIGIASIAASKGYKVILTMPDTMSLERRRLLASYGAELVLTEGKKGMKGAIEKAEELALLHDHSFIPSQFKNPANPDIHRKTTAREIINDTEGQVGAFVAGVGTGGTVTGNGEVLKAEVPGVHIVAVEPDGSAVLSGDGPGPHKIQGIGAGFIPDVLNVKVFDEVIRVTNEEAKAMAREIAVTEGLLVGISSGANVVAAIKVAKRQEFKGKNVITILCDTGERYLSTGLFD